MAEESFQDKKRSSWLDGANALYLETIYESYLDAPNDVDPKWRAYFDSLPQVNGQTEMSHAEIREAFAQMARMPKGVSVSGGNIDLEHERLQTQVAELINAFRVHGHLCANIDPLGMTEKRDVEQLALGHYGLDGSTEQEFDTGSFAWGPRRAKLGDIYKSLMRTYCGPIGVEYMHIANEKERLWLQKRFESVLGLPDIDADAQKAILERVVAAEGLEKYLGSKYPGAKRFGLEGGESLIGMLDEIIQRTGEHGVKEIVVGMAHRGRLNVLVNTMGKLPSELFDEFEGKHSADVESGDVKYHQGFSSDVMTPGGHVHLSLAFNPSHLEIVSPVVVGSVRARQERRADQEREEVFAIQIHGDAAFAGQGVVMETFNMSQTRGYKTGGAVHIVVNNQIGFTTSSVLDARSTLYCTDVAKMIQSPILHVNADYPEAVIFAAQLAVDYRREFKRDVVIDLTCYRRHGHNEADEPAATQPMMYKNIRKHKMVRELYAEQLIAQGRIQAEDVQTMVDDYRASLDAGHVVAKHIVAEKLEYPVDWSPYFIKDWRHPSDTTVPMKTLKQLADGLTTVPDGFTLHSRVKKLVQDRKKMTSGEALADWGYAENLAYATLLHQGFSVRLSGQDCGRGTFFHRHAVWHNQDDGETYIPLRNLSPDYPEFLVIDSFLSEEAVLAFEYGFATTEPKTLVIWEAQFGDFANGAQVVIDQFISSGEQKWGRLCNLAMFLPHGFEGMGPEHSSARLERYLQLCAQHNIQVCVPSTPAQVFHMIRRHMVRPVRRPLIVMTPKSLLRHKAAVSTLDSLANGQFEVVLAETDGDIKPASVRRVILCSGKVYYELHEAREKMGLNDTAILRIEQLYPFPELELKEALGRYPKARDIVWCQEEPMNQGAWYCSKHHLEACLRDGQKLRYAGREASASPAVGYASLHLQQQRQLIEDALSD